MEILAINPRPKKKKHAAHKATTKKRTRRAPRKSRVVTSSTTVKESKTMANENPKRRRRRHHAAPAKTIIRYRTRGKHNPSRARRYGRKAREYAGKAIAGVNVGGALRSTLPLLIGALAAKFAAKKFTSDAASEGDNWTWKNYGLALVGGFVAAVATSAIFKSHKGTAQKVLEGALLLTAYKVFVNEIAAQNDSLKTWFGGGEGAYPDMSGYDFEGLGAGETDYGAAAPGDLWQGADGESYVMGEDYQWRPVGGMNRQPQVAGLLGDALVNVKPAMGGYGDALVNVKPAMGGFGGFGDGAEVAKQFERAYGPAW